MSGTIKGAGCSHGGAFMVGYSSFRDESILSRDQMAANAISEINELEADGLIDPTCNYKKRAVYIASGSNDESVPTHNQEAQW